MPIKFPFSRRTAPSDTWTKCPSCDAQVFNKQLERNQRLCPSCGHHFRMSIGERIDLLLDPGSFTERDAGLEAVDRLGFLRRQALRGIRLEASRIKTGLRDAVVWGTGTIEGQRVAIGIFDFRFMGGSMGSVVGEKLARCSRPVERWPSASRPSWSVHRAGRACRREPWPSCSWPARGALVRLDVAGIPFITVLTDPTTGGVLAGFASLGDVKLAEPRALIGFAGARVASDTVGEEMPEGFQTAEFLLDDGFVDAVVPRPELRASLARLVKLLPVAAVDDGQPAPVERPRGPIGAPSGFAQRFGGAGERDNRDQRRTATGRCNRREPAGDRETSR